MYHILKIIIYFYNLLVNKTGTRCKNLAQNDKKDIMSIVLDHIKKL